MKSTIRRGADAGAAMTDPLTVALTEAGDGLWRVAVAAPDGELVFLADSGALREIRAVIERAIGDAFARRRTPPPDRQER